MNINAKYLNKIAGDWTQFQIRRFVYYDLVGFISGMQSWFNICNLSMKYIILIKWRTKKQQHMIISDTEKTFDKI